MDNTDITAVITSFKSEKKIINCINSLGKNTKIIVIENGHVVEQGNHSDLIDKKSSLKKIPVTPLIVKMFFNKGISLFKFPLIL